MNSEQAKVARVREVIDSWTREQCMEALRLRLFAGRVEEGFVRARLSQLEKGKAELPFEPTLWG